MVLMRLGLFGRKRALALFARSMSVDQVVQELAKRYPYKAPEEIKRILFLGGKFGLKGMQGAGRQKILAKMQMMTEHAKKLRKQQKENLGPWSDDPQLRQERDKRLREAFAQPEELKRRKDNLERLKQHPAFKKSNLKGIHKYYRTHSEVSETRGDRLRSEAFKKVRDAGTQKYYGEHPEARKARARTMREINEERKKLFAKLKELEKRPSEKRVGMTRQQIEQRLRELDQIYDDILKHLPKEERLAYLKQGQKTGKRIAETRETTEPAKRPTTKKPSYEKARAEFMTQQGITETELARMENAFKEARKTTKQFPTITKIIAREARIPHMKAYVFSSWAMTNKWPELTRS